MNNKGFTIIEVMIAMVILGMTLLAATSMIIMTKKLNTTGNMQTMAINFARDKMESLREYEAFHMTSGNFSDQPHIAFTRKWKIEDTDSILCKRITVEVYWNRFNSTKSMKINTLHKGLFVGGSPYLGENPNDKLADHYIDPNI